jgi:hypothetical protein
VASAQAAPGGPEPLAREAKWFTESRCLNREVRVVLEGVDKYNNLFGSVFYPEADKPANLAEAIMSVSVAAGNFTGCCVGGSNVSWCDKTQAVACISAVQYRTAKDIHFASSAGNVYHPTTALC